MKTKATGLSRRQKPYVFDRKLYKLTIAGGTVFWITSIATSLIPLAAEYRAAYSNWSIQTVWIGSLLAGMMFGCCVSYGLLHFFEKIPAKGPIPKSLILSAIILVFAIILIDVPMLFQVPSGHWYYFLIGVMFNAVRFLFLGYGIGYLYKRM